MSSVVYIKMVNGEDIVATLLSETLIDIDITNPLAMKTIHDRGTTMSGFFPWTPIYQFMNSVYKIHKYNIIANVAVPIDVQNHYNEIINLVHGESEEEEETEESTEENEDFKLSAYKTFTSSNTKITIH